MVCQKLRRWWIWRQQCNFWRRGNKEYTILDHAKCAHLSATIVDIIFTDTIKINIIGIIGDGIEAIRNNNNLGNSGKNNRWLKLKPW